MSNFVFKEGEELTADLANRFLGRLKTILSSTTGMIVYFMMNGDDEETAKDKMKQISTQIRLADGGAKFDYCLGDTQPLLDAVDQITELPFLDSLAKQHLINLLTPTI